MAASAFIGSFAFGRHGGKADIVVGLVAYYGALVSSVLSVRCVRRKLKREAGGVTGIGRILQSDPRSFEQVTRSSSADGTAGTDTAATGSGPLTTVDRAARAWRRLRSTIKTVLENDDSRQIYYFLCLNLAYMGVQMVWGIWTNSLGLISDCEFFYRGVETGL
jgi:hypothetical protein